MREEVVRKRGTSTQEPHIRFSSRTIIQAEVRKKFRRKSVIFFSGCVRRHKVLSLINKKIQNKIECALLIA